MTTNQSPRPAGPVYRHPPSDPGRTVIRRAPARMAYDLVLGGLLCAAAAIPVVVIASWLTWIASILLGLFALTMVVIAFKFPGVAQCPGCGAKIFGLDPEGDNIGHQCEVCRLFVSSDKGQLMPMPEQWVAIIPTFGVVVGAPPGEPPELCCVCAAPATRKLPLQKENKPYLEMPHCAEHEGGARVKKDGAREVVTVRSLAFARAWAERHGYQVIGNNRSAEEPNLTIPWQHGLVSVGILGFGVGVYALLEWAERSGTAIAGNALMVLLYAIFGKKVLAGIFVSIGAMAFHGFVWRLGAVLRKRWGLA